MATTRVEEAYSERDQTVNAKGDVTEIEIPYIVFGAENEDAALSAEEKEEKAVQMLFDENYQMQQDGIMQNIRNLQIDFSLQ